MSRVSSEDENIQNIWKIAYQYKQSEHTKLQHTYFFKSQFNHFTTANIILSSCLNDMSMSMLMSRLSHRKSIMIQENTFWLITVIFLPEITYVATSSVINSDRCCPEQQWTVLDCVFVAHSRNHSLLPKC